MQSIRTRRKAAIALAISLALTPSVAFASTEVWEAPVDSEESAAIAEIVSQNETSASLRALADSYSESKKDVEKTSKTTKSSTTKAKNNTASKARTSSNNTKADKAKASGKSKAKKTTKAVATAKTKKILSYNRKLIEQIGTQESTGHTICCPSFSCAYADAVMDGTVHDHTYYTCSCCTWTDWGGGGSWDRCVGTDEELLREAYDQISAGKPTVIHVVANTGEHWIALIGYKNAKDPDHLTLANFIALDPWDGAQIDAAKRYSLYGDGCEHISDRKLKKSK